MLLISGYSPVIKSVEIIFEQYYFVKLLGDINSRKQNDIYIFFVMEGNLLFCTEIKVTDYSHSKQGDTLLQ